jgi:hypothetical protein
MMDAPTIVAVVTHDEAAGRREAHMLTRCGVRARAFHDHRAAALWEAEERAVIEADRRWRKARRARRAAP